MSLEMANNQDARPFVDLKKDAVEFRVKFNEDIGECLDFLDAKITSLICDPDSFGIVGKSIQRNTVDEFSKAKYDIFIGIKNLINEKEQEWLEYISEMKKLFIENVEIFLAGTKLEVTLPPPESVSSQGAIKSPGNRKSVTSSIYPMLSSITKNIPVLGSSFQESNITRAVSKSNVGDKTQFNRGDRFSTSSIELGKFIYNQEMDVEEESESELDRSRSLSSTRNRKLSNSLNTSQSSLRRSSSLVKVEDLEENVKNALKKEADNDVSETDNIKQLPPKRRGRPGKLTKNKPFIEPSEKISVVLTQTDVNVTNPDSVNLDVKTVGRKTQTNRSKKVAAQHSNSSTDENENQLLETSEKEVPLKGRRGRSVKTKAKDLPVATQHSSNSTDENEDQIIETSEKEVPSKGRRGRAVAKTKSKDLPVAQNGVCTDDNDQIMETIENKMPLKGRRGRSAVTKQTSDLTDQIVTQKTVGRGRRAVKSVIEEDIYKPGPSKSPKRVSFSGDNSSSDELDIQTPLARPVKSAARRKTLLPNLEYASGADIIPGNISRSKSKRKTISGVSEIEAMAPPKRLKVSQKTISSLEDDSSASYNLSESDDNYSEWMSLRSVDGKIPTRPAIYEVKVWRAKKPAYIGSCENLRQKLTLYNLRQNSGHKHLDKFIDRNFSEIQVRFEIVSSIGDAKEEVKDRIENFKAQHKNPPAYN